VQARIAYPYSDIPSGRKDVRKENHENPTQNELTGKTCKPCKGGADPCTLPEAEEQLGPISGWYLTHKGQRIRKDSTVKNFVAGMDFFNKVASVAEDDNHHPDLHLVGYRNVSIELWTHAIGGLSENDFILAAKMDELPIDLL